MSVDFELPCECPICGHELTIDDIDYQPKGDKLVSMLYCPKCSFKKKLDTTDLDDFDDEDEEDDDFDPMACLKDPDEDDEDTEDDDEGVDLFPNGRDYDAEDEDGP